MQLESSNRDWLPLVRGATRVQSIRLVVFLQLLSQALRTTGGGRDRLRLLEPIDSSRRVKEVRCASQIAVRAQACQVVRELGEIRHARCAQRVLHGRAGLLRFSSSSSRGLVLIPVRSLVQNDQHQAEEQSLSQEVDQRKEKDVIRLFHARLASALCGQ